MLRSKESRANTGKGFRKNFSLVQTTKEEFDFISDALRIKKVKNLFWVTYGKIFHEPFPNFYDVLEKIFNTEEIKLLRGIRVPGYWNLDYGRSIIKEARKHLDDFDYLKLLSEEIAAFAEKDGTLIIDYKVKVPPRVGVNFTRRPKDVLRLEKRNSKVICVYAYVRRESFNNYSCEEFKNNGEEWYGACLVADIEKYQSLEMQEYVGSVLEQKVLDS